MGFGAFLCVLMLVIIVAVVTALWAYKIYKKKQAKQYEGKITKLTELQKRGLAYGAIYSLEMHEKDVFDLNEPVDFSFYKSELARRGGITGPQSAKIKLERLSTLAYSFLQNEKTSYLDLEISKNNVKNLASGYIRIYQVGDINDTYAWDIVRLSALTKWSYRLNYITEDQFTYLMQICCAIVHERGQDWEQFTYSFLLGRRIDGFDNKEVSPYAKKLLFDKNSPYKAVKFK